MRKSAIAVAIAVALGLGVASGFVLDSDSTAVSSSLSSYQPVVTADPEPEPILNAIDLMKDGFDGPVTESGRELHERLVSQGYYYWTTYPDMTERFNYDFAENGKILRAEFAVAPNGVHMDVMRFGLGTEKWSVECAAPVTSAAFNDINQLLSKVNRAAAKHGVDPTCWYDSFS